MASFLDQAEDTGIPHAIEEMARLRASSLLRAAAHVSESEPWLRRAAERFMLHDEAEFVIDTNQGRFRIVVKRG